LTTAEALKYGVADFEADDLPQLLQKLDLSGAELRYERENWAERVVRFLTHPIVSSLLMTLGILGVIVELRTPGFGVPGIVGIVCLASFFWGHWLVELAGWEQLLLLAIGLVFIALEVFVLPGFGVAGVIGVVALVAALSTSLYGAGASLRTIGLALSRVMISTAIAAVGFLVALRFINVLPGGKKLVLASALAGDGRSLSGLTRGNRGTALTPLRPAGIASFEGKRIDVVSQGEFVEAGQSVEIVRDDGNRVVVRAAASEQESKIG
jgi:membrane-bound serine protease (ClpP class)